MDSYNRMLVTLEAWPGMKLATFSTYRRLWDALGCAPGTIEVAISCDFAKFDLTERSLRRALDKLEAFGLIRQELRFSDGGRQVYRYQVHDAVAVAARARVRSEPPAAAETPAVLTEIRPAERRQPLSQEPTRSCDESRPSGRDSPNEFRSEPPATAETPADLTEVPPHDSPQRASGDWHESCATPPPAESPPPKHPPCDIKNQEIKKSLTSSSSNSRTNPSQEPRPRTSPARTGPADLPIARDGDDWNDFGGPQAIGGALNKLAEQFDDPAKAVHDRDRHVQALAAKVLQAIRRAEAICETPAAAAMDPAMATKIATFWRQFEGDKKFDPLQVERQFSKILDAVVRAASERRIRVAPGAYLNTCAGNLVKKLGGVWVES